MCKVSRCRMCDRPLAINKTAWTCGPMFCSFGCGVEWAKTLYEDHEYSDDKDLQYKAAAYFADVAEEINREDYGARASLLTAYDPYMDITTVFEATYEGDELISQTCVGWYYGEPTDEETREAACQGMQAIYV